VHSLVKFERCTIARRTRRPFLLLPWLSSHAFSFCWSTCATADGDRRSRRPAENGNQSPDWQPQPAGKERQHGVQRMVGPAAGRYRHRHRLRRVRLVAAAGHYRLCGVRHTAMGAARNARSTVHRRSSAAPVGHLGRGTSPRSRAHQPLTGDVLHDCFSLCCVLVTRAGAEARLAPSPSLDRGCDAGRRPPHLFSWVGRPSTGRPQTCRWGRLETAPIKLTEQRLVDPQAGRADVDRIALRRDRRATA